MPIYESEELPREGEIRRGCDIGKSPKNNHYFVWHACIDCGRKSWVVLVKGQPQNKRCCSCAVKNAISVGHRQILKGNQSGRWKGGRITTKRGYIQIWVSPDDFFYPMVNYQGYVLEHRLVMAKHLGRCLQPWEIVHHKKGVAKDDNQIEGLQLVTDDRHTQITILENRIKRLEERVTLLEAENTLLRNERNALLS